MAKTHKKINTHSKPVVLKVGSREPPGVLQGAPGGPQQKVESFIFTIIPSISNTMTILVMEFRHFL